MRVLVTGSSGQLGFDVVRELQKRQIECISATRAAFDLTDEQSVKHYIKENRPNAVIHCAAYTAVDKAEDEPELCWEVNVDGTRCIAEACRDIHAKLIYISTDYIFNGEGMEPYGEDGETSPINIYGKSKLAGELLIKELLTNYFIVRISWVFGKNGNNFVKTMLRLAESRSELSVVDDQIGSPTYTEDLSKVLVDMVQTNCYGIYHITNEGECSWVEFAEEIFRQNGNNVKINKIPSSEYKTRARRPLNSKLAKTNLTKHGFEQLPSWKNALMRFLK